MVSVMAAACGGVRAALDGLLLGLPGLLAVLVLASLAFLPEGAARDF